MNSMILFAQSVCFDMCDRVCIDAGDLLVLAKHGQFAMPVERPRRRHLTVQLPYAQLAAREPLHTMPQLALPARRLLQSSQLTEGGSVQKRDLVIANQVCTHKGPPKRAEG